MSKGQYKINQNPKNDREFNVSSFSYKQRNPIPVILIASKSEEEDIVETAQRKEASASSSEDLIFEFECEKNNDTALQKVLIGELSYNDGF